MNQPVLRLRGVRVRNEARELLSDIWLDVYPGEVTGVIGLDLEERSALTDFLAGEKKASAGIVLLERERIDAEKASDPLRRIVSYVGPRELLSNNMTIADNLFVIGRPRKKGPGGWLVNETSLRKQTLAALELAQIQADPGTKAGALDDDERHRLEFIRAILDDKPVIAFNSPLNRADFVQDQEKFSELIAYARQRQTGIVMMMSSLDNLMRFCDRAVIVRKGRTVSELKRNRFEKERLLHLMDERSEMEDMLFRPGRHLDECVLELQDVVIPGNETRVLNLRVCRGEVVGLVSSDDEWNGRFARALTGDVPTRKGVILRDGRVVSPTVLARIGTDENRAFLIRSEENLGLLPRMSLQDNVLLPIQNRGGRILQINGEDVKQYVRNVLVEQKAVPSQDAALWPVASLSMEQKLRVWMARAAIFRPNLCIMLGLRSGLNVEAQRVLDEFIRNLTEDGTGVLLIETSATLMHRVTDTVWRVNETGLEKA